MNAAHNQVGLKQQAQEVAETEYKEAETYRREMNACYESAMQHFDEKQKTEAQAKEMCREAIASVVNASHELQEEAEKTPNGSQRCTM